MKLKIGNAVYLQKYDAAYLLHYICTIPAGMISEIFNKENGEVLCVSGTPDGLSFEYKFEDEENVAWLMSQDYILDFEKLKDKSVEEIEKLHDEDVMRAQSVVDDFNKMPKEYKEEHFGEISDMIKKMNGKSISYHFMIAYLQGEREFKFPKGYGSKKPKIVSILKKLFSFRNRSVQ